MMVPRKDIRPAILDMPTIDDLRALILMCSNTLEEDADFVRECVSEIYWREKENKK